MRNPQAYEHSYTVWKRARREYLHTGDQEPDYTRFGLSEWEAEKIKERVDRGLERTT